ncbi:MAG: SPOR domain-containing protein [Thiogranum sp.]|jgi:DedD protein|nr:SPOR domain-containing protein [Thiogranum sp.]
MDFLLKQRLVGAIVLVALGVIFIPMLLEGPNRNLVPEMQPLPEPEGQDLTQPMEPFAAGEEVAPEPDRAIVQGDVAAEADEPSASPDGAEEESLTRPLPLPEPESEPESAQSPRAETTPPRPEKQAEVPKPAPAGDEAGEPGPLGNWVVQMASFSSEQNALRLRDRLRKAGFVTQVEKVLVDGKTHFRVRVGPYLERAEAERDRNKMADTVKLNGRVLSYP